MKDWALEKGATHYTHWFQPLTGLTREARLLLQPDREGTALAEFSGKELIQGEPTRPRSRRAASARPSRPAATPPGTRRRRRSSSRTQRRAAVHPDGVRVVDGEALDQKIPLLRSMDALSKSAIRALRLFGDLTAQRVFTTVGAEQEYFLDRRAVLLRAPGPHQHRPHAVRRQAAEGPRARRPLLRVDPRAVLAYMLEAERELQKLGVPVKTRHNEVAPNQYELAPIFENSNVGSDHQQLTMQILQNVGRRYGLVCLLHEKPFAGVNGSGKHNNWSMGTDTGQNLLEPGDDPSTNLRFLFFCAAVIAAVDKHQALLRASVANAGQDHRLGANEAPPAIISIFLGAELEKAFESIASGSGDGSTEKGVLGLGTSVLPPLPMHGGDRNRTSPFAFTGNKFEFRALGSSMSLAFPNTVLNTIAAEAIDSMSEDLENALNRGASLEDAVGQVVKAVYSANKQVLFMGDNYSEEWHAEAEQRGLLNLRTTPEALPWVVHEQTVSMFGNYNVLSERELESRYEVFLEQYVTKLNIEAETAASIARTMILPPLCATSTSCGPAGSRASSPRSSRSSRSSSVPCRAWRRPTATTRRSARRSSTPSTCATRSSRR
jgi:glutamine synthetase